jgi:hypothetical protein
VLKYLDAALLTAGSFKAMHHGPNLDDGVCFTPLRFVVLLLLLLLLLFKA